MLLGPAGSDSGAGRAPRRDYLASPDQPPSAVTSSLTILEAPHEATMSLTLIPALSRFTFWNTMAGGSSFFPLTIDAVVAASIPS